jgi:hypothetical protein
MVDYFEEGKGINYCYLGMQGSNLKLFIFGDSFLRSFISIYDFDNKRVGLAPHIYSQGSITEHKYGMKPWVIALISVSVVIIFILMSIAVIKIKKYLR